ncbi:PDDEXK nuclease domain-containing protein [Spirosoma telluris]|uniref:PDDEXK nuclease domain-containing protein n=1 Tax=Spirosoma telluris TaxID=2183553 RepID=UPI0018DE8E63
MINLSDQFTEVVSLIQQSRNRVMQQVNAELINLYWNVGAYISQKVARSEWGNGTVDQLADFIKQHHPDLRGFNRRGLYRMKQFYDTYQPLHEKVSAVLTQISWTNHLAILSQCKTNEERQFYLIQSAQEHYSSRELERQIDSGLFERTRLATAQLSDSVKQLPQQAADVFRDSYVFEFLDLPNRHTEADLQQALIRNLSKFLLETGRAFTLAGENVRIQVGNQDFYIDLLLYHRSLQCLVAVELKVTKFKPEHIGQLNFYLEALDRDYRLAHENPSIGLLLCASKESQVVEYALSRSLSPTLVADYSRELIDKHLLETKMAELYGAIEPLLQDKSTDSLTTDD